jgi:hypothetical protein
MLLFAESVAAMHGSNGPAWAALVIAVTVQSRIIARTSLSEDFIRQDSPPGIPRYAKSSCHPAENGIFRQLRIDESDF